MNKQPKKIFNKKQKGVVVAEFSEKAQKAKGMVFTNYQGLTHQQIEGLKKSARTMDAEYVITKNRLLMRSLPDDSLSEEDKMKLVQPTATLFLYGDPVEPLKALAKMIKDFSLPTIKFGLLEGKTLSDSDVIKLSSLPTKPVLQAQLLGQMMSPIQGLHRALSWNTTKLVMTLNAISNKKSAS
jgi:large subunit ribosomal protein L10